MKVRIFSVLTVAYFTSSLVTGCSGFDAVKSRKSKGSVTISDKAQKEGIVSSKISTTDNPDKVELQTVVNLDGVPAEYKWEISVGKKDQDQSLVVESYKISPEEVLQGKAISGPAMYTPHVVSTSTNEGRDLDIFISINDQKGDVKAQAAYTFKKNENGEFVMASSSSPDVVSPDVVK